MNYSHCWDFILITQFITLYNRNTKIIVTAMSNKAPKEEDWTNLPKLLWSPMLRQHICEEDVLYLRSHPSFTWTGSSSVVHSVVNKEALWQGRHCQMWMTEPMSKFIDKVDCNLGYPFKTFPVIVYSGVCFWPLFLSPVRLPRGLSTAFAI